MNSHLKDLTLLILFIIIGVLTRTIFHIAPNVEFVTGLSLAGGYFFTNKKLVVFIPVAILFLTDLIIGNTIIYLFTWSGFLVTPLLGIILKKFNARNNKKLLLKSELMGVIATLLFFLWTNFGVVLTTSMYAKNLNGIIQSYINALPFLRNQLFGNLILIPIIFISTSVFLHLFFMQKSNKVAFKDPKKLYN